MGHWPQPWGPVILGTPQPSDLEGAKKDKFAERLGTFMCNPNFNTLDYCAYGKLMRTKKLVLNYFEHIATCFPNISLRFHWTTCTCLYNFLHVCVSNSPWLGFQHHPKVRFHFRYMFCSYVAGTCCGSGFFFRDYLLNLQWQDWSMFQSPENMVTTCFNHPKNGHYTWFSEIKFKAETWM
jgi:hypothetical protein